MGPGRLYSIPKDLSFKGNRFANYLLDPITGLVVGDLWSAPHEEGEDVGRTPGMTCAVT